MGISKQAAHKISAAALKKLRSDSTFLVFRAWFRLPHSLQRDANAKRPWLGAGLSGHYPRSIMLRGLKVIMSYLIAFNARDAEFPANLPADQDG